VKRVLSKWAALTGAIGSRNRLLLERRPWSAEAFVLYAQIYPNPKSH
jgi:hypothetical protein